MPDFNVRSESLDVEQVMEQIRARIREKRGVDYTEQQLQELAAVKLEKFLDPRGVRSDLLQRFKERKSQYEKPELPLYAFEDTTIYDTHRGPLRWIRNLLNPLLKLLFNPQPIIHALHSQVEINALNLQREAELEQRRMDRETLYFEIIHNLVFELTRTGIEMKNLKMRVESLASRLEFNERRARALESVVVYKAASDEQGEPAPPPGASRPRISPPANQPGPGAVDALATNATPAVSSVPNAAGGHAESPGQRSRRRRRRRGRRSGASATAMMDGSSTNSRQPLDTQPSPAPPADDRAGSESATADDEASPGQPRAVGSDPGDPRGQAAATTPPGPTVGPGDGPSKGPGGSDPDQP
jgi:hypothetical protein